MQQNGGGGVGRDDLHVYARSVANRADRYPTDDGPLFVSRLSLCSRPNRVRTQGDEASANHGTLLCAGLAILLRGNLELNEDSRF